MIDTNTDGCSALLDSHIVGTKVPFPFLALPQSSPKQCNYITGILVTLRVLFENVKADHIFYLPGPEENEESSTVDLQEFTLGSFSKIDREWFIRFDS